MSQRSSVPLLALGTAQWGMDYGVANTTGQPDTAEILKILALARSAGIATLDTARAYGTSEETIGALVTDDWRVITKLDPHVYRAGMSARTVRVRVADSLAATRRALKRHAIDTLLLHRPLHQTAVGGAIWSELREEQEAGGIRRLGVSADAFSSAAPLIEDPEVQVVQVPASLLDLRLWRNGFFQRARENGVEVFVRGVFLQGVAFLPPDRLPAALAPLAGPLERIRDWASQHGATVPSAFLSFMRAMVPATVVIGCETESQLRDHLMTWFGPALPDIEELAGLVPDLDETILNPALWPLSPRERAVE